jgi:hypothetical protein
MDMRGLNVLGAAFAACLFAAPGLAAAPETIDPAPAAPKLGIAAIPDGTPYRLDTEMTVHNWVLCISADRAESLVRARGEGKAKGAAVYADLKTAKACGIFPEMQVILQQPVYEPSIGSPAEGRVFGALVKFSGQWAKAFVVSADE